MAEILGHPGGGKPPSILKDLAIVVLVMIAAGFLIPASREQAARDIAKLYTLIIR